MQAGRRVGRYAAGRRVGMQAGRHVGMQAGRRVGMHVCRHACV